MGTIYSRVETFGGRVCCYPPYPDTGYGDYVVTDATSLGNMFYFGHVLTRLTHCHQKPNSLITKFKRSLPLSIVIIDKWIIK